MQDFLFGMLLTKAIKTSMVSFYRAAKVLGCQDGMLKSEIANRIFTLYVTVY